MQMSLKLPRVTSIELLPNNPPESSSSGYVPSHFLEPYESIQNHEELRPEEFYDEAQTMSRIVDYIEPGQEHQPPTEHIKQLSGYAVDSQES